jgi:hypothetical protein
MRWRKLNNVLHRDIGYFFVGMTLIYAISGIAINPSFNLKIENIKVEIPNHHVDIFKDDILDVLAKFGQEKQYKSFFFEDTTKVLVFFGFHNMEIDIPTGNARIEWLTKKPILWEMNFLHYNPGIVWTLFSDLYCVGLIVLAFTGMFILQGKKGLTGRGKWFVTVGMIVPIIILMMYI